MVKINTRLDSDQNKETVSSTIVLFIVAFLVQSNDSGYIYSTVSVHECFASIFPLFKGITSLIKYTLRVFDFFADFFI